MSAQLNRLKLYMLEASRLGARLFRRNIGMGWIGKAYMAKGGERVTLNKGDVVISNARPFHNGEVGQSDLWGWRTVTITPDMVGRRIAQHIEIEDKGDGDKESAEQAAWGMTIERHGGVYGVAREPADVVRVLSAPVLGKRP